MDPKILDNITFAIALYRIVRDDIDLYYYRCLMQIDEPSLFSSVAATYLKVATSIPGYILTRKVPELVARDWSGYLTYALMKFKFYQMQRWMVDAEYADGVYAYPLVQQLVKGVFNEVIPLNEQPLPNFQELRLRDRIYLIHKLGEYAEKITQDFPNQPPLVYGSFDEALRAGEQAHGDLVFFYGAVDREESFYGNYFYGRIAVRTDDRCLSYLYKKCSTLSIVQFVAYLNDTDEAYNRGMYKSIDAHFQEDYVRTSLGEVFSAIGKSEFKKSLWSVLSIFKISSLAGMFCNYISPSGFLAGVVNMLDELFKVSSLASSLQDVFQRLFSEIIPAIWYQDPSLIKPELFSTRMDVIYKAIVCAKSHDTDMMREVCREWDNTIDVDGCEIIITFHEVLSKMKKFVTSSTTNHLTSVMRSVINDLTIVEQQLSNFIRMGKVRYEPYCVGLRGEAGIGKSTLVNRIISELGKTLQLTTHLENGEMVFDAPGVITEGVKHDEDIYNNTKAILFDDANIIAPDFQEKGGGNMSVKFFQCQGSVPFSLNKANLEEKKGSYWGNNLTMITSNLPCYGFESKVMDQGAWLRRIHVDVEMQYKDLDNKNRANVRFVCSFINYENSTRQSGIYENVDDFMKMLRTHCETYWARRQRRLTKLAVCKFCRELPHNCICAAPITLADHANSSALWMSEERILSSSWSEVAKTIVAEEAISFAGLQFLLSLGVPYWTTVIAIGLYREFVELCFGKDFDWFRCIVMTLSLLSFPISIIIHVLMNYSLLMEKVRQDFDLIVIPLSAQIPLFLDEKLRQGIRITNNAVRQEMTPTWFVNWQASRLIPKSYKELMEARGLQLFAGFSVLGLAAKVLYDSLKKEDYVKTTLGQPATEVDKQATFKLNEQIGGTPEVVQHGKSVGTHEWKQPMRVLYKPGGQTPHGANFKCNFTLESHRYGEAARFATGSCFLSTEGLGTNLHNLPENGTVPCHIIFRHEVNQEQLYKISYNPNTFGVQRFNDIVLIPYTDDRKKLSIRRDYTPAMGDKYMVNGKVCSFIGVGINTLDYPQLIIMDCEGKPGMSGSMVVIVEREGVPVQNEIVGVIVVMFTKGQFVGKAGMEPFLSAQSVNLLKNLPRSVMSVDDANKMEELKKLEPAKQISAVTTFMSACDGSSDTFVQTADKNPWLAPQYNLLQPYLTPAIVSIALKEKFGVDVSPMASPHSILGHLKRNKDGDIECNIGEFVGHVQKPPAPNKSKFYKTEFYEQAKLFGNVDDYTIPNLKKFVREGVYHNSLLACARQMNSSGYIYDQAPFWSAAGLVKDHIVEVLGDDLSSWTPYDIKTVITGDRFTTAMNREAAKGFPHKGIKDDWVWGTHDEPVLSQEICQEVSKAIDDMDNHNIPPLNISQTALKDEIISKEKDAAAQVRVFFAGNTSFLILCRAYLGKLMNLFVQFRDKLFAKIGMNAIGAELEQMARNMFKQVFGVEFDKTRHDMPCWADGDFSKYDKMLLVLKYAIHVLWELAKMVPAFRENAVWLNRIRLILTSLGEYIIFLGEDIFIMRDKLPSGVWATALINCICEMIIEVLMFYYLLYISHGGTHAADFVMMGFASGVDVFRCIAIANYGDDNIKCVNMKYWYLYTHAKIMQFSEWLHMKITPARKHETTIDLKPIKDVLFLKRVFIWNDYLNRHVGALELDSIAKMLAFSDTKNISQWRYAVILTARRELSFHGPLIYQKFCDLFKITITWEETLDEIEKGEWKWDPEVQVPIYDIVMTDLSY